MKPLFFAGLLLVFCLAFPAQAFDLTHPASLALARDVRSSLIAFKTNGPLWPREIDVVEKSYRDLPRAEITPAELWELKFVMQHWRFHVKPVTRTGRIPPVDLPIFPVKGSKHVWESWSKDERFSLEYYEHDEPSEVRVHGVAFRPGDVILLDQNQAAGDGIMASVVDEPRLAAHVGAVVFLKKEGKIFPAVLEIHEFGMRAIPLSLFLAPRFTNYAEVFRPKHTPEGWADKVADTAAELMTRPHAYDLWANEDDDRFLTCSAVALHLLKSSGAALPTVRSTLGSRGHLRDNLAVLGVTREKYLMPGDFARDERFQMVGVVDSRRLMQNLVNELFTLGFAGLLRDRVLDPAKFPFSFRLNRWGLGQLERGSLAGRLLVWWFGFTLDTLPSGPKDLMALYKVLEPRLAKGGKGLSRGFTCPLELRDFSDHDLEFMTGLISIHRLSATPEVQGQVAEQLKPVAKLFSAP